MATERTLTRRELNRALLARQLLLERAPGPIPKTLERIGGIQAQYAPSMYIGLWSRLRDLERDAVTRALERRSVVQGTLMRATIHLVSARDYWPISIAVRKARRDQYLRYPGRDVTAKQVAPAARRLRSALAKGPLSRTEIDELLDKPGLR
jgi:Winged helix DNA-binding domain